jgi:hypothetical protein
MTIPKGSAMQFIPPPHPLLPQEQAWFSVQQRQTYIISEKTYVEREDKKTKQIPADSTECFFVSSIDVLLREQPLSQKHARGHDPLQ